MTSFNILISGLTCNHCIKKLENALLNNHNIVIEHISRPLYPLTLTVH